MQSAPCISLLPQLTTKIDVSDPASTVSIPLVELLEGGCHVEAGIIKEAASGPANTRAPGVHSYVNRILKKSAKRAGVESELTSHSFRHGGAQHANGNPQLSAQWIFDRGAWNLTATNKAFSFIFNTTNEDQKIARVSSGWSANENVHVSDLSVFDTNSLFKISRG